MVPVHAKPRHNDRHTMSWWLMRVHADGTLKACLLRTITVMHVLATVYAFRCLLGYDTMMANTTYQSAHASNAAVGHDAVDFHLRLPWCPNNFEPWKCTLTLRSSRCLPAIRIIVDIQGTHFSSAVSVCCAFDSFCWGSLICLVLCQTTGTEQRSNFGTKDMNIQEASALYHSTLRRPTATLWDTYYIDRLGSSAGHARRYGQSPY